MKQYLLIAVFAAAIILGTVDTASACSCVVPGPGETLRSQVSKAKKNATAIFVGKAESIRYSDEKMNGVPIKMFVKLSVERSWRGPQADFIEVETANICCICGFTFEEGKTYIIYSNSSEPDRLGVSSCSRTAEIIGKSGDEKYLGKARKKSRSSK